jgi:predicted  nucleic acid-binding Zn-ribbon protein
VAQTSTRTKRGGTTASRKAAAGGPGHKSLEGLNDSIDAAQAALKDLRSEMSRGSRELLKDVDTTLKDTRKNLRSVSRRVAKDLEEVQQTVAGKRKRAPRKTTAGGRSPARKRTTRK